MPRSTPGKRLVQARLSLGARLGRVVTLEEIAEQLGVSAVTVGRWEKDQNEPDLAMLQRLATIFGVTPGWLAFGEEEAPPAGGQHAESPQVPTRSVSKRRVEAEPTRKKRGA